MFARIGRKRHHQHVGDGRTPIGSFGSGLLNEKKSPSIGPVSSGLGGTSCSWVSQPFVLSCYRQLKIVYSEGYSGRSKITNQWPSYGLATFWRPEPGAKTGMFNLAGRPPRPASAASGRDLRPGRSRCVPARLGALLGRDIPGAKSGASPKNRKIFNENKKGGP
jgi:hypothetical protein